MIKYCKSCNTQIPEGRLKALPSTSTCASCSKEDRCAAIHIIHHKTGNEVQVVKDAEAAKAFSKLTTRAGFGTLRGLSASAKGGTKPGPEMTIPKLSVDSSDIVFERIGDQAMSIFESKGFDAAHSFVTNQLKFGVISDIQGSRIFKILVALKTPTVTSVQKESKPVYNPYSKYEPKIQKDMSEEIEYAFRNWRK